MGWVLSNKPKALRATPELAKEFAEMDKVPHERPLSQRRLEVYFSLFKKGEFRPVTWAKAFCEETGVTYRINGQHTSTLLTLWEGRIPEYHVIVEEYTCTTLKDVARLYNTFDSKMQSRNVGDINMSFASTIPELVECATPTINLSVSGIWYHRSAGGHRYNIPPAERAEVLLEQWEFVLWLDNIRGHQGDGEERLRARHLSRQPVVGAMFATWEKDAEDATEFWEAVRDETGNSPELPDRKLARYLLGTHIRNGPGGHESATSREMYAKSLTSWNAWRRDEPTRLRYYADKPLPEAV